MVGGGIVDLLRFSERSSTSCLWVVVTLKTLKSMDSWGRCCCIKPGARGLFSSRKHTSRWTPVPGAIPRVCQPWCSSRVVFTSKMRKPVPGGGPVTRRTGCPWEPRPRGLFTRRAQRVKRPRYLRCLCKGRHLSYFDWLWNSHPFSQSFTSPFDHLHFHPAGAPQTDRTAHLEYTDFSTTPNTRQIIFFYFQSITFR